MFQKPVCVFTSSLLFHLHYNIISHVDEAISSDFVVSALNCLASTLVYTVTQMKKLNCEKSY